MSTDASKPQGNRMDPSADDIRQEWERFRQATFTLIGPAQDCTVWAWASASPFDFVAAGMHLKDIPGVAVDVGVGGLAVSAYGALHIIPLDRLTAASVGVLQPRTTFDIKSRQAEILAAQQAAIEALAQGVKDRLRVKMPATGLEQKQFH